MKLMLFQVVVEGAEPMFLAAIDTHRASLSFINYELGANRPTPTFTVERVDHMLPPDMQLGLDEMLAGATTGRAAFDGLFGWGVVEVL